MLQICQKEIKNIDKNRMSNTDIISDETRRGAWINILEPSISHRASDSKGRKWNFKTSSQSNPVYSFEKKNNVKKDYKV